MNLSITITAGSAEELMGILAKLNGATKIKVGTMETEVPDKPETKKTVEKPEAPKTVDPPAENVVDINALRAIVAEKAQAGKRDGIKEILQSYGVTKLPDLSVDAYQAVYDKVKKL